MTSAHPSNRTRTAAAILRVLKDHADGNRITPTTVRALSAEDWARAALLAGCHQPPDVTTRELVAELAAELSAPRHGYLTGGVS